MSRLRNGHLLRQRYQVLSLLGQGSFARVYLTNDQQWRGNLVALKEIPTGHFSEAEYAQFNAHFLREAAFLMRLQHPGLPRVIEFFAEGQNYYLALEWIPGNTLEQEIKQRPTAIAESEALTWGRQMLEVLRYLHSQQPYPVLLGDLKPANVVVGNDGKLKVVDFGVAAYAIPDQKRDYAMVTPGFSPPEQYLSGSLDARCDLYAWAASLFWCLCPGDLARYRFDFPPLSRLRPDLSPELDELLTRCLQPSRENRYYSAEQVLTKLDGLSQVNKPDKSPADILSALYQGRKKRFDF